MSKKTKHDAYGDHFKATAVELGALPGVQAQAVAAVLDIHPVMLYRWKKQYRDGEIMGKATKGVLESETQRELVRLKKVEKAHERLKMEHELLKKASSTLWNEKRNLRVYRHPER